jgi:hypothetical protein
MVVETKVKFTDGGFTITQILHDPKPGTDQQKSEDNVDNDAKLPDDTKNGSSVGQVFVPPSGDKGAGVIGPTDSGGGIYGSTGTGGGGPGFGGVTIIFGNLTTGCRCTQVAAAAQKNPQNPQAQEKASAQGSAPAKDSPGAKGKPK